MKIYLTILVLVLTLLFYQHSGCGKRLTKRKICLGTSGRMSVPTNRKHHYKNLKDRYTNCTYVDGNLELTWIEDENLDLSFLNEIREITGYLLISHVDVKRIVFKKLMIIRGRNLFKLNVRNEMFALIVTLSKMESLELPSLRDILAGSTGFYNNYNLCYIRTIKWDELLYSPTQKPIIVYNFTEAERDCPECHSSCEAGCWGPGAENCQVFSKINCSPQCFQGRCFGPNPRECCHLFCVGGCTGPTQADCLACKNFYDGGVCKQECPPMIRYNTVKYVLESNPDGRYAYGATCVKNCPDHLLRDSGACVRTCPPNKKAENKTCILCDGPCPKNCIGVDIIHADNIANFEGCTVIQGSITILDTSFEGYQDVYSNFTFGPRHGPMHPSKLNVFKNLQEVTGYISIQASHPDFKNLSYFSSLEKISGRTLTEYFAALYIVKTSLQSLNMRSLKSINSGSVAILENQDLCLTDTINWQKIMKSNSHSILMEGNGKNCKSRNMICHPECSSDGCWGIDPNECLSCQNFILDNTCIDRCDPLNGMYDAGNHICEKCHEECLGQCSGPGNSNCTNCKNVRDGPYCVPKCPITKYNNNSVCLPCHENCVDGCVGPENNIGDRGCLSCEKAIVDSLDPNIVIQCLKSDEACPENHYLEYILGYPLEGALKSLTGKSVCRRCHPQCSNCTAYGTHYSICKCMHYISGETCEDHCPRDNFADEDRHVCVKCSDECRGGCYGSSSHDCIACRNFRVYIDSENKTSFNCTPSCPFDKPHKIFMENDPYCSEEANVLFHGSDGDDNVPAIIGGILSIFIVLGILLAVVSYYCLERARTKENTVKMTMRMSGFDDNEPLKPTDVKPNLAKLRIVKEHELRKGGILGYGAFGTVFKGVWLPTDENTTSGTIKIPVAIKVLQESSTSKDFLEEAFIMASVDHPNLLKLLAVCIANECMLVTQLMPLGCLLDYVRNNKEKIGSKALLNWAAQIARGMAYLEQHRMVHRDLALRNVLLQTPGCVKVTDFGLARLLDLNEEEYKALGNNKVAIKWLALECIENRSFSHKSDVWAFGITIWEMFTYGKRPYENVLARDVPNLLRKGERLPQPEIATIDVYMIMIKTWMLDAESRPCFKELADEFSKMARDPGRYLVILGDKYMRLPSYTPQDEKELIRTLSMPIEGPEVIMDAEEYLQQNRDPISTESQPPPTPIKKFMDDRGFEMDPVNNSLDNSEEIKGNQNEVKNACFENCKGPNHVCKDTSLSTRYCSDPVSSLERGEIPNIGITQQHPKEVKVNLPVDDEDYLVPSSQSCNSPGYMDLVEDAKISSSVPSYSRNFYPPRTVQPHAPAVDNLEYHLMNKSPPTLLDPPVENQRKPNSSDEDTDEHEYYNDYDGLRRELQPLNNHRSETTV